MDQDDQMPADTDPQERALTGNPEGPPQEPDNTPATDAELIHPGQNETDPSDQGRDGQGDYGSLPGYGDNPQQKVVDS